MGIAKSQVVAALAPSIPQEIVEHMINEYLDIKTHFSMGKYRPSELNGGRFAECVLRLLQHLDAPPHTAFGTSLGSSEQIIRRVEQNTTLQESIRIHIPRLTRFMLDVRNRRNVAHVGGDVDPNHSDAVIVTHCADWILTEIIRLFYNCSIETAKKISDSLNEVRTPVIADVGGFLRVQNTNLNSDEKTLVILYHVYPDSAKDSDLQKWLRYTNVSRFRTKILGELDNKALIHYQGGSCVLLPKGIAHVEKNVPLDLGI